MSVPRIRKCRWAPQPVAVQSVTKGGTMQNSVNVLALVKDGERYVFLYDEKSV